MQYTAITQNECPDCLMIKRATRAYKARCTKQKIAYLPTIMAESFVVRGDNHPPKIHLFTGEGFVTYKYANGKMAYITQISLVQMVLNSTKEVQLEVLASLIQDLTPPEIREIRDLTGTA